MMSEQQYSLGTLMKAARKSKKLNQAEVATAIGCSQLALSKMEHGLLIPSAPQWFLFSRFTAIPPESLEVGTIDRMQELQFTNADTQGFKIPRRYRQNRVLKLRVAYAFVRYLELTDPELYKKYLQAVDLDAEFFVDFDNLSNFQLYLDTLKFCVDHNLDSPQVIRDITKKGQDLRYWSHLRLEKTDSVKEVFTAFVSNMSFFHADFKVSLLDNGTSLKLTYRPELHLKNTELNEQTHAMLNTFRQYSFERLVELFTGKEISIKYTMDQSEPLMVSFEIPL